MTDQQPETVPDVHFMRITARTVEEICALSETLTPTQRHMVTDNAHSIAEAHFSESAWLRAIYADDTPVGFIMIHTGSDYDDGIDCPGVFLWRFMIAGPYQGRGYGRRALEKLIQHLKAIGVPLLYTSCGQGEGSPEGFYRKIGFTPTGDHYGHEIELLLRLDKLHPAPPPYEPLLYPDRLWKGSPPADPGLQRARPL